MEIPEHLPVRLKIAALVAAMIGLVVILMGPAMKTDQSPAPNIPIVTTSSLKTNGLLSYQNAEYGFSFSYPEKYQVRTTAPADNTLEFSLKYESRYSFHVAAAHEEDAELDAVIPQMLNPTPSMRDTRSVRRVGNRDWDVLEQEYWPIEGRGMHGGSITYSTKSNGIIYVFECLDCLQEEYVGNVAREKREEFLEIIRSILFF